MTELSARAAISYAMGGELLKLYGLIVAGVVLSWLTAGVATIGPGLGTVVVGALLSLLSLVVVISGIVGVVYKVLTDVRAD